MCLIVLGLSSGFLWQIVLRYIQAGSIDRYHDCLPGSYSLNLPKQFEDDSFAKSIAGLYEGRARMCTAGKLF